jgi:hypothetical protein
MAETNQKTGTPAARWREEGKPDPHDNRYDCERADLCMGQFTDDELANAVFLYDHRRGLESMAFLTAAKDRIRWLSRALGTTEQERRTAVEEMQRVSNENEQLRAEIEEWKRRASELVELKIGYREARDRLQAEHERVQALILPAETQSMDFGQAIRALKAGVPVCRAGWNGKGMWLELFEPSAHHKTRGRFYPTLPYIGMKTANDKFVPWLASQTDMLAKDWEVAS